MNVMLRQAGRAVAGEITNDRPVDLYVIWRTADIRPVIPDDVVWGASPAGMGTLVPFPTEPQSHCVFTPDPGATGPVTFSAKSIQSGLNDFEAVPATVNQVDPVKPPRPPSDQITAGEVSVEQAAGTSVRASGRRK